MEAPQLEYDLTFEERDGYLLATLRAVAVGPANTPRILREIRSAMMDARTGRLLWRSEIAHTPTEADTLEIVNEIMKTLPGMRIAFVNEDPRHSDVLRFAASLSLQSGEEHMTFRDVASAEKWLLEA
jgi:hypothetical protein